MNKRDVIKYCLTLPNTIEQSYELTQNNIYKRQKI